MSYDMVLVRYDIKYEGMHLAIERRSRALVFKLALAVQPQPPARLSWVAMVTPVFRPVAHPLYIQAKSRTRSRDCSPYTQIRTSIYHEYSTHVLEYRCIGYRVQQYRVPVLTIAVPFRSFTSTSYKSGSRLYTYM